MSTQRIGVVGAGYWGRHYVRLLHDHPTAELAFVVDPEPGIRSALPVGTISYSRLDEVPRDAAVDGVVVVTPATTHSAVVGTALDRGWASLVEKPFTTRLPEAEALRLRALTERIAVFPGQVYAHSGAAQEFARQVRRAEFGELRQVVSTRQGFGLVRTDVSVLDDLAPHDLTILEMAGAPSPDRVLAITTDFLGSGHPETASVSMFHGPASYAHLDLSWVHPTKVRTTTAIGAHRMATFDDTDPSTPVRVYDRRLARESAGADRAARWVPHEGPTTTPAVSATEPLRRMLDEFLATIAAPERARPALDRAVRFATILEALERSSRSGRPEQVRALGSGAETR